MLCNRLIFCHPLLLPSVFPNIRVFSNELAHYIRCPNYWSFRFSNSPPNEYSGLISFRIDWLDLLAVQGTLKSLDYWIRYSTWRNSVLFLVWDDAGGWVHWNQSFHMHLCYPGPVSCVFTSWASFPQGSLWGVAAVWGLVFFIFWNLCCWLWHPCLLSWQEIFISPRLKPWGQTDFQFTIISIRYRLCMKRMQKLIKFKGLQISRKRHFLIFRNRMGQRVGQDWATELNWTEIPEDKIQSWD